MRHFMKSAWVLTFLVAFFSPSSIACGSETAVVDEMQAYLGKLGFYSLPLEIEKSRTEEYLAVKTHVGAEKVTFIVSTATIWTTIDTYTAREWKTPDEMGVTIVDSAFGALTNFSGASARVVPELRLGEATFTNMPVIVRKVKSELWSPEGIIGCDFLVRNHCILDARSKKIYMRQAAPTEELRSALRQSLTRSGFGRARLKLIKGTGLACDLIIKDTTVPAILATATPVTILDSSVAKTCGLSFIKNRRYYTRIFDQGKSAAEVYNLEAFTFKIGNLRITSAAFSAGDLSGINLGPKSPGNVGALIGLTFLESLGALIDFDAGEMWLKPASAGHKS
jgi:hypothetical protein